MVLGAILVGAVAGAAVPVAISYFGTVIPGVGSLHAAGGVAATLQWASIALASSSAAWSGAALGAATAAAGSKNL
ncbi:hypothetical protein THRCLA_20265 [Thraustotheca clavata]|uniref:Uncharacterized protein n=1 Tax=Thraustotheca clavata TaxID=74557 RepID=A0A1W0A9D6_9STRA|nr:hypothetical protein THRCLA_20265 [Thraustotheca clavata]